MQQRAELTHRDALAFSPRNQARDPARARTGSPPSGSTRITSAPRSARTIPAIAAAGERSERSSTRTALASGPAIRTSRHAHTARRWQISCEPYRRDSAIANDSPIESHLRSFAVNMSPKSSPPQSRLSVQPCADGEHAYVERVVRFGGNTWTTWSSLASAICAGYFRLTLITTTAPGRVFPWTRIARSSGRYRRARSDKSSPSLKSAGCTIATSASRPDGINCCLSLVARRLAPHRLRILLLSAVRYRSRDSRLWFSLRHASVHHGWSLLASAPVPIFPSGAIFSRHRTTLNARSQLIRGWVFGFGSS